MYKRQCLAYYDKLGPEFSEQIRSMLVLSLIHICQGNENEEVEIYRSVTEGTFDAYLYQLVENKQKFIAQIMTSKAPVRVADDEDETALSYSEIEIG